MTPPPRRLRFAVGSSLLSASLSLALAGCDDKAEGNQPTVNPKDPEPEPIHVNEGPKREPTPEPQPEQTPEPTPELEREPIHVNEGPVERPEPVAAPQ